MPSESHWQSRTLRGFIMAALLSGLAQPVFSREEEPAAAPDFALRSLAGKNIRLSEYRSDVVVLAFWTSWCGECRAGLATLQSLQQSLQADGLQVLSINFDERQEAARDAAAGVSFPILLDADGEAGRLYDVDDLPFVVLVDRAGRVRHRAEGAIGAPELTAQIKTLLAE